MPWFLSASTESIATATATLRSPQWTSNSSLRNSARPKNSSRALWKNSALSAKREADKIVHAFIVGAVFALLESLPAALLGWRFFATALPSPCRSSLRRISLISPRQSVRNLYTDISWEELGRPRLSASQEGVGLALLTDAGHRPVPGINQCVVRQRKYLGLEGSHDEVERPAP